MSQLIALTAAMPVKAWAVLSSRVTTSTACRKCRRRAHDQQSTRKGTGFVASPGTKSNQVMSGIAPDSPALTQSVVTLPNVMLFLRSDD